MTRSAPMEDRAPASPTEPTRFRRLHWHYLGVCALAWLVGLAFLQAPGFGDEFTYWSLAFNLHERGREAWSVQSYHDIRWPVWGLSWLWQGLFGPGLGSFYLVPLFYVSAAAALVFTWARQIFACTKTAWACAVALLFLPLINGVVSRAMPDLSESVFGGCAVLAWWSMMRAEKRWTILALGVTGGLSLSVSYSNRPSGLFIAPILAVATLALFPRRWRRLFIFAGAAAAFFLAECAIYQAFCGDWWHTLHANMGNKAAKGTDPIPMGQLPLRFLPQFFHGNRFDKVFALLAALGSVPLWRSGKGGKAVVLWFGLLLVEVSCIIQSLHPVRPLVGSAARYLAVLAVPMALLAGAGAQFLLSLLGRTPWPWMRALPAWCGRHALPVGAFLVLLVGASVSRPRFTRGYIPAMRRYLETVPAGAKVFTHPDMRALAFLVCAERARELSWEVTPLVMARTETRERQAEKSSEWWYLRDHLWLHERKALEQGHAPATQPALGSYLETPETAWILREALAQDGDPELVFYRRRQPADPPARILLADSPELLPLAELLPWEWKDSAQRRLDPVVFQIPPDLRGKAVRIEVRLHADAPEAFKLNLTFKTSRKGKVLFDFKPNAYALGGMDFMALRIPENATSCEATLQIGKKTTRLGVSDLRLIYDPQP